MNLRGEASPPMPPQATVLKNPHFPWGVNAALNRISLSLPPTSPPSLSPSSIQTSSSPPMTQQHRNNPDDNGLKRRQQQPSSLSPRTRFTILFRKNHRTYLPSPLAGLPRVQDFSGLLIGRLSGNGGWGGVSYLIGLLRHLFFFFPL